MDYKGFALEAAKEITIAAVQKCDMPDNAAANYFETVFQKIYAIAKDDDN